MRMLTYTVAPEDEGRAIRSVVPRRFQLGAHAFRRLKVQGGVRVNGEPARADRILHAGEVVTLLLPSDEILPGEETIPCDAAAPGEEALPPSFLRYLDEDMLVAAKGAPLATLPSAHIRTGTLREQLIALLGADAQTFHYHPVNRLDKGTSGLLVIARHAHAQRLLTAQLHSDAFLREYLAVTQGVPAQDSGIIDAPIARLGAGAARCVDPHGRRAVTHYRVEAVHDGRALLRLRLETGRTHQIRVHLASIGCPIVGDYLYGTEDPALPGRFALHSARLRCTQPITGARIELHEPLPPELAALLSAP